MPRDKKGGFHLNTQRAIAADKNHAAAGASAAPPKSGHSASSGPRHITVHDHGDGSYHSDDSEGQRGEHPDAMAMQDHMSQWSGGQGNQSDEMPISDESC